MLTIRLERVRKRSRWSPLISWTISALIIVSTLERICGFGCDVMGFADCCVSACSGLETEGTGRLGGLFEGLNGMLEVCLVGGGCVLIS